MTAARSAPRDRGRRALRVAFFAMFPEDNMATWTFCRWPVDHGELLGIRGRLCAPSGPDLHARMTADDVRFRALRMIVYWYLLVFPRRLWQLWRTRRYDVALVQRGLLHPKSRPFLERLLAKFGPPIVYHLDDALWVLEPGSYRTRVRLAQRVVTGTEQIASYARALGATVEAIEYPIEAERYPVRDHADRNPVRMGWTGARPQDYLGPALPGVLEACRRTGARLTVVSGRPPPSFGEVDRFLEWAPWTPEHRFDALSDIDIGILPLEDTELHRGKEPFKLKEYMACGVPVVASPVGHVPRVMSDGREGLFAHSGGDWARHLEKLILDPALRARMGAEGRIRVAHTYDYGSHMERLVGVLESAARAST